MSAQPNILWIVTTQWRASATGYAGDINARTPRLDALAAESVNFTQAVTPHPFGPFARAALLTGVPSPENGVRDYYDPLPAGSRTIAHAMAERGYTTAFFGKWHLAKRDPAAPLVGEPHAKMKVAPNERGGFEFWEGFESGFWLNDPWLHGTRLPEPMQFRGYQSDVLCERAGQWLSESADGSRPWFGVVSLEAPHPPYFSAPADTNAVSPTAMVLPSNVPRGGQVEEKARAELAGYYAHISATDRAIGGLLDVLKARGPAGLDNTVVVFTSIHGDMHGAHGLFRKGWPYEESVRVPLLVRPARATSTGSLNADLVSLSDLPAMALAWADRVKAKAEKEAQRQYHAQYISMPSVVALPYQCDRRWRGVRTKTRKLILGDDGEPWLFFDLENDPLEQKNLVGEPAWLGEIERWRAVIPK